ncbi:acyl-CoA dehydrogenase family protein [Nocardia sp. NPDC003482]
MRVELSDEAVEYGRAAAGALRAAGGDELVRRAEGGLAHRESVIEPVLAGVGAWELGPLRDAGELEAAAALCRAVGYRAVPYPVAERLARPDGLGVDGLVLVAERDSVAAVAGLSSRWVAVTIDGVLGEVVVPQTDSPPRESAFVTPLEVRPAGVSLPDADRYVALALVLPCWTLLGMLDRALDLARGHVLVREQFGRPLAEFQSVRFQLTDAEVERRGVEMLARYALWSLAAGDRSAVDDALALRLAALEAADLVFRVAHQLHGALGFCDESFLSWLSRYSLPLRRLPYPQSATEDLLSRRIGRRGLTGLFSEPPGA